MGKPASFDFYRDYTITYKCYYYTQLSYISHPVQVSTTMDFEVVCTMVQMNKLANAVDDTLASYGDAEDKSWDYSKSQTLINSLQIDGIIRSWLQVHFYNAIQ